MNDIKFRYIVESEIEDFFTQLSRLTEVLVYLSTTSVRWNGGDVSVEITKYRGRTIKIYVNEQMLAGYILSPSVTFGEAFSDSDSMWGFNDTLKVPVEELMKYLSEFIDKWGKL